MALPELILEGQIQSKWAERQKLTVESKMSVQCERSLFGSRKLTGGQGRKMLGHDYQKKKT